MRKGSAHLVLAVLSVAIAMYRVNVAVTAWTGNPMLGQLASGLVESLLSESGGTGNSGFDNIFNEAFGGALKDALGG